MKSVLPFLLLIIAISACDYRQEVGPEVAFAGDSKVLSIGLGECFQDWSDTPFEMTYVASVQTVDCDSPHDNEVFEEYVLSDYDRYPGEGVVSNLAFDHCIESFDSFVETPYLDSRLEVGVIWPTEESWSYLDDRTILCYLFDIQLRPLVGSMQGSQR